MKNIDNEMAGKILDFLAKKTGYCGWHFQDSWWGTNSKYLCFCTETTECCVAKMTSANKMEAMRFMGEDDEKTALEKMFEDKNIVYVRPGIHFAKDDFWIDDFWSDWISVFLKTDSLESLAIAADLEG